jgi:21S rRNA (uridine2791-2'-O)-methyltransferase
VIGIDLIPAQPPKGVSTIQGNFLSPGVQALVKEYLQEYADRSRFAPAAPAEPSDKEDVEDDAPIIHEQPSYIDAERSESVHTEGKENVEREGKLVDVR